jgi:hypothetical protein
MHLSIRSFGLPMASPLLCLTIGCSRQAPVPSEEVRPVKTMVVAPAGGTYLRVFPGRVEASKSAELSFQIGKGLVGVPNLVHA